MHSGACGSDPKSEKTDKRCTQCAAIQDRATPDAKDGRVLIQSRPSSLTDKEAGQDIFVEFLRAVTAIQTILFHRPLSDLNSDACGHVLHRGNILLSPNPAFRLDRAECTKGRPFRSMNRHTKIGTYIQVPNCKVVAHLRIVGGMFNYERAVITFDELAKRMRQRCLTVFGPMSTKSNLTFEVLPVAFFLDERHKSNWNVQHMRYNACEPVERVLGWGVDETKFVQHFLKDGIVARFDETGRQVIVKG